MKYVFLLFLMCAPLAFAQQASDHLTPESGDTIIRKQSVSAHKFIVASAHPLASEAAYEVLKKGGHAIDAMVAVQTVLGLVEPQSSGLGGGAFLVYYDAQSKKVTTYDARETAPFSAPEDLFLAADESPMAFFDAVVGGRSVGTPGTVKLLWETHQKYGRHNWPDLLQPAIVLATEGFEVGARLANAVANDRDKLGSDSITFDYFFPDGQALQTGQRLQNKPYADTLELLATHGGDYFYTRAFSQAIVTKVKKAKNAGYLSTDDFEKYKVIERPAVCSDYHEYEICGMGPPSSGAVAVNQTLGILQHTPLRKMTADDAASWLLIAEASRLAFADRGLYIADPDYVPIPSGLLADSYLRERAALINIERAAKQVSPGKPPSKNAYIFDQGRSPEQASTSHFVIVDQQGNIVSMTSTIENGFGSRLMVKGFLLNNELTDFSFSPETNGSRVANRVEAGKRPRSSMAPTIVFKNAKPYLALGSPGGSRIINYVTNTLIAILDWNYSIQQAFDMPHIVNRFGPMDIESNSQAIKFTDKFEALGYPVSSRNLNSGLHGVLFTDNGMIGAADKRREGVVSGE